MGVGAPNLRPRMPAFFASLFLTHLINPLSSAPATRGFPVQELASIGSSANLSSSSCGASGIAERLNLAR